MGKIKDKIELRCMRGWRGIFCVIDNCVSHDELPLDQEGIDEGYSPDTIGRHGFRWACRLHDWAGGIFNSRSERS